MRKFEKLPRGLIMLLAVVLLATLPCHAQAGKRVAEGGPDQELKEFRLDELEAHVQAMPPGTERDYFTGMLANRTNHIEESIELLSKVVPAMREARPERAKEALDSLADDYMKTFRYGDASRTIDDLVAHFAAQFKPQELEHTKDHAELVRILREAPPQTIEWRGAVDLKTERNAINSQNVELTVNGVKGPWLLDTGANFSVVTKGLAERLGLQLLPGASRVQAGLTGIENPLRIGLLPKLELDGATLHNVVLLVLDDANLNISLGESSYQINGIIGYPVFQALGSITFTHDGEFRAGSADEPAGRGARIFMSGLTPILQCEVEGKTLPFGFDTGASGTDLLQKYAEAFHAEAKSWKKAKNRSGGAGGVVKHKVYVQPQVKFVIGDKAVTLKKVTIYRTSIGSDHDELYGNLGQDIVAGFASFTLDFSAMTFRLGEALPAERGK